MTYKQEQWKPEVGETFMATWIGHDTSGPYVRLPDDSESPGQVIAHHPGDEAKKPMFFSVNDYIFMPAPSL